MLVWFCIRAKLRAQTLRHPCLARSSRCIDPLHFYNLLKSTSIASPRTTTLASLVKGEVLSPEKIRATTGGIVTPPTLPKPHYPLLCTTTLASLVKGEVLSPEKKSGDYRRDCLTTILRLHQPFQNRTIPLAFRRVRVCVCLYGFASVQNLGHKR